MTAGAPTIMPGDQPRRPAEETVRRHLALDPRIRAKRAALEAQKETTWAAVMALNDRIREFRRQRDDKKSALAHELSGVLTGARKAPAPDDPRQQAIEWVTEELGRLEVRSREAELHRNAAAGIYQAVSEYLERAEIATIVPIVVDRVGADSLAREVARIRANFDELAREEDAVTHAPPLSEALERLDQELARQAAVWQPSAAGFFSRSVQTVGPYRTPLIPHPVMYVSGGVGGVPADMRTRHDFEAFFVVAFSKVIRELWTAAIKASVPAAKAIPSRDVPKRLAAIAERRRDLGVREEAAILTAAEQGIALDRRADADPAVVLCTVLASDGV